MVHKAICAGIYNDLGSGSNCDLCVIKREKVTFLRGYDVSNERTYRRNYTLPKGTTPVVAESVEFFKNNVQIETIEEAKKADEMEVSS